MKVWLPDTQDLPSQQAIVEGSQAHRDSPLTAELLILIDIDPGDITVFGSIPTGDPTILQRIAKTHDYTESSSSTHSVTI